MNEWKQQPIDNGIDDQMKEETLDLWNEENLNTKLMMIKKNEITDEVSDYQTNEIVDKKKNKLMILLLWMKLFNWLFLFIFIFSL